MIKIVLRERALGRVLAGHPWIYASDLRPVDSTVENGSEVSVVDERGSWIGVGLYHSQSKIPVRLYTRQKESLTVDFFRNRILDAKRYRDATLSRTVRREIWSEADFLPGLIVDRYDDVLVVQMLTLGMEQRREMLFDLLMEIYSPRVMIERNDVASRQFEKLPLRKEMVRGEVSASGSFEKEVFMGDVRMKINLMEGHKTGSYLDQVDVHPAVARWTMKRRVLDCFTYHGGFALHAQKAGADRVVALDISKDAIQMCRQNEVLNGLTGIEWKSANVFDELPLLQRKNEKFDVVILDPPSFTKTRDKLPAALRGYKEIHLKALRLLERGGLLATYCCSHHVDMETFRAVILDAAFDTRKILRLREVYHQPKDHPVIPAIPETEYIKGFLFEVHGLS